jgi:hypothetical protein
MSHAREPQHAGDHAVRHDPAGEPLSERDRELLDFEREWWRFAGAKDAAIRDRFACSAAEYYQALNRLLDREAAVAHDSLLVRRLRRQRLMRQRERSARRLDRG